MRSIWALSNGFQAVAAVSSAHRYRDAACLLRARSRRRDTPRGEEPQTDCASAAGPAASVMMLRSGTDSRLSSAVLPSSASVAGRLLEESGDKYLREPKLVLLSRPSSFTDEAAVGVGVGDGPHDVGGAGLGQSGSQGTRRIRRARPGAHSCPGASPVAVRRPTRSVQAPARRDLPGSSPSHVSGQTREEGAASHGPQPPGPAPRLAGCNHPVRLGFGHVATHASFASARRGILVPQAGGYQASGQFGGCRGCRDCCR